MAPRGLLVVVDDPDCGCFRVTCADGFCIDQPDEHGQNGLHELIVDYSRGGKGAARKEAVRQRNENLPHVQLCAGPSCEWCR